MVQAMVNSPGRKAGMISDMGPPAVEHRGNKATNILVTVGDLAHINRATTPDSWRTTPASAGSQGPFGLVTETVPVADGSAVFSVKQECFAYVICDGVVPVNSLVQASDTTAGHVKAFAPTDVGASPTQTTINTARDDHYRIVGLCKGFADNWDTGAPTDGSDGDIVCVWIPEGGY
jgi:hypothetical protein